MNKGELVEYISKITKVTKKDTGHVIDVLVNIIQKTVKKGGEVAIFGFGTFKRRKRYTRYGTNPRTREHFKIPAKKVPIFKPGRTFKTIVKEELFIDS